MKFQFDTILQIKHYFKEHFMKKNDFTFSYGVIAPC